MKRIILVAAVLALIVPSFFIFTKHEKANNASLSSSYMEDVRVANKGLGKSRWILSAKKVEIPTEGNHSMLQSVSIDLPEHEMQVVSDSGIFNLENRDLALSGNIKAESRGYVIRTDSILLKSGSNEISSDDKVTIEGNNFKIEGEGFRTNSEKKVTLNNNVKATFF